MSISAKRLGAWGLLLSTTAFGRGVFIHGDEAKTHGGTGLLSQRGAPALFHNPALLHVDRSYEIFTELDAINVSYSFHYPGEDSYTYRSSGVIPYAGFAQNLSSAISLGIVLLPVPPQFSEVSLNSIMTRETGEQPVPVNVEHAAGKQLGIIGALGLSYSPFSFLSFGVSLGHDRSEVVDRIYYGDGQLLRSSSAKSSDSWLRLGTLLQTPDKRLSLALTLVPWRQQSEKGDLRQLSFPDYESSSIDDRTAGPREFGLGLGWQMNLWTFQLETVATLWKDLGESRGLKVDYQDTWDRTLAISYQLDTEHHLNFGVGYFPQNIGDGLMKTRTPNYIEVKGFGYGDIDSIPRFVYALGFGSMSYGQPMKIYLQHQSASRSVIEAAKAYGDHEVRIWSLGVSLRMGPAPTQMN